MKNCENCKYSEPIGGGLACMGQKGMPFVKPIDSCERWKTNKQTNADRIRAMSDEELAKHLMYDLTYGGSPPDAKCDCVHVPVEACEKCWLDWLRQEAMS